MRRCRVPDTLRITNIHFLRAGSGERTTGVRGWVSFDIDESIQLASIAVRRRSDGGFYLSFPERRDSKGKVFPYMRPLGREARRLIEEQVLGVLRAQGDVP